MQNRAHHRDGEEALQITRCIPVHDRNGLTRGHPDVGQCRGQAVNALAEFPIGTPHDAGLYNLLRRVDAHRRPEQAAYQQRKAVGGLGLFDDVCGHCRFLPGPPTAVTSDKLPPETPALNPQKGGPEGSQSGDHAVVSVTTGPSEVMTETGVAAR